MAEEIVVKYTMRAPMIALCVFACLICGAMIAFGWETLDHHGPRQNPEAFIGLGVFGLVWAVWKVRSLASGKPYLETSVEGVFVGAGLHCYIPWENVADISLRHDETMGDICAIRLKDSGNVYFDKLSHRLLRKYFTRELPVDLKPGPHTAWTSERLAQALRNRWRQELDQTPKSRT